MNRFLTGKSCVPLWNGPRRTSTPPSTSAGEHRLRCTTITVCKRPNCRKSCSVSSNTPWSIKVFLCCAALTRSTGCRTPATPKSARSRFAQPENSTSSLPLPKPGSTSFPTTTVDKSSSLVTRSMKPAPSLRNTSATWTRVCPSSCPATTSHRTTLPKTHPYLAQPRLSVLLQLAQLLRLPVHPIRLGKAAAGPAPLKFIN